MKLKRGSSSKYSTRMAWASAVFLGGQNVRGGDSGTPNRSCARRPAQARPKIKMGGCDLTWLDAEQGKAKKDKRKAGRGWAGQDRLTRRRRERWRDVERVKGGQTLLL